MRLVELRIPIDAIRAMPDDERNFLVTASHAHTELAAMIRVVQVAQNQTRQGEIYDAYVNTQYLILLRLMAGKIYESWNLLKYRYFGTQMSKNYDNALDEEGKLNLDAVKKYFGRSGNIIELIRNEAAFHYTSSSPTDAIAEYHEEYGRIYIADDSYNDLFQIGEYIMDFHLLRKIDGDFQRALAILVDEVAEIGGRMTMLLRHLLTLPIALALRNPALPGSVLIHKLGVQTNNRKASIPCFLDTSRYPPRTILRHTQVKQGYAHADDPPVYATVRKDRGKRRGS